MMNSEIWELVSAFLLALGGGAAIIAGLVTWFGNQWASRLIQNHKQKLDMEIEAHKTGLQKSEFIFQKQFEAASAMVVLMNNLSPRHIFPDMDWHEACDYIANNFSETENNLHEFLSKHGAVIPAPVVELIGEAIGIAGNGKFDTLDDQVPSEANKAAEVLYEKVKKAEKEMLDQVHNQVTPTFRLN